MVSATSFRMVVERSPGWGMVGEERGEGGVTEVLAGSCVAKLASASSVVPFEEFLLLSLHLLMAARLAMVEGVMRGVVEASSVRAFSLSDLERQDFVLRTQATTTAPVTMPAVTTTPAKILWLNAVMK